MASEREGVTRRGDNFDFEDLCLDPYQANFDDGRSEGNHAGLQAGYDEGRSLGQRKALEIGLELGYMHGVATTMMDDALPEIDSQADNAESLRRVERVRKGLSELLSAIDTFPTPGDMFYHTTREDLALHDTDGIEKSNDSRETDAEEEQVPSRPDGGVDIAREMQRIRAKFKLISVQLKMPQLSLTRGMDKAAKAAESDGRAGTSPIEGEDDGGGQNKAKNANEGHDW